MTQHLWRSREDQTGSLQRTGEQIEPEQTAYKQRLPAAPVRRIHEPIDIEAIRRTHPLLTVFDQYGIVTYGTGARRTARCPFHEDHEPSLTAYLDSERFHCFGCGASGDVIELVERLEGVDFLEAVRRLTTTGTAARHESRHAHNHGTLLGTSSQSHAPTIQPAMHASERETADIAGDAGESEEAEVGSRSPDASSTCHSGAFGPLWHPLQMRLAVLTTAATIYRETLLRTPQARTYLEKRGIIAEVASAAYLGYADGSALKRFLIQAPELRSTARRLGLIDAEGAETMRGRLIIPEVRSGLCIWLHGRILPRQHDEAGDQQQGARSSTTPALPRRAAPKYRACSGAKPLLGAGLCAQYGRHAPIMQGLYQGSVRAGIVVVEGAFDLLTFLGWRLPVRCVALIGTHASAMQLNHLVTLAAGGPIWIALDTDAAGEEAALHLAARLAPHTQAVYRLRPPGGAKDFAEGAISPAVRTAIIQTLMCSVDTSQTEAEER